MAVLDAAKVEAGAGAEQPAVELVEYVVELLPGAGAAVTLQLVHGPGGRALHVAVYCAANIARSRSRALSTLSTL